MLGGALLAVGILIAGLSGLCSLAILFGSGEFSGFDMWPAVLMFGGIPFAIGVAMALGGRALIRRDRRQQEASDSEVTTTVE
jgi:hypothetical protein